MPQITVTREDVRIARTLCAKSVMDRISNCAVACAAQRALKIESPWVTAHGVISWPISRAEWKRPPCYRPATAQDQRRVMELIEWFDTDPTHQKPPHRLPLAITYRKDDGERHASA